MAKGKKCEILVINQIAPVGLKRFPAERYAVVNYQTSNKISTTQLVSYAQSVATNSPYNLQSNGFTRTVSKDFQKQIDGTRGKPINFGTIALMMVAILSSASSSFATTKGLSQIVTPELQGPGDLSLSFQVEDEKIGNPYQLQAEMGLTKWAEFAVFRGFKPDDWIFGTEFGLLTKEPYLLSIGFVNWSPHMNVDPQPYIEAGYYTEHHKFIAGVTHVDFRNEAILGYAYDFNETWRVQVDFQSGSGNSSTIGFTWNITRDFQVNPAIYVTNDSPHEVLGYVVFTYTFHLWGGEKREARGF